MANKTYENWLEIDLQAIEDNLKQIRRISGLPVAAVLKADAYGHGVLPVSRKRGNCAMPGSRNRSWFWA